MLPLRKENGLKQGNHIHEDGWGDTLFNIVEVWALLLMLKYEPYLDIDYEELQNSNSVK